MKAFSYLWRMAWRRKAACLLVVVSTMTATVFMLFYPSLIDNTRKRLKETYSSITVTGSILSEDKIVPAVSGSMWEKMQQSGYFSSLYGSASFVIRTFPKDILEESAGEGASEQQKLIAFQNLLASFEEEDSGGVSGSMKACSSFSAEDELVRIREDIRWLEGYDESCLEGDERICIISDKWGYAPGDTIPLLARVPVSKTQLEGIFHLKVAGTYPGKITKFAAVMPLKTMEDLTIAATAVHKQAGNPYAWNFGLNAVYFTVRDNQQLDQIKAAITESGLRSNKLVRVRIDDRILKETVGPIESNLAQLEGSYLFFFVMIAAIGFLLSFLLARGRKPEYAVMRMLGESRLQITLKALLEQFVLCLGGVLLGAAAVGIIGQERFRPGICAAILLCYTVGAAVAVLLTVRVNVMDILRDKE
ncbi:MAG TPA: hypothetical protein H9999_03170 [Candidatus Negativibacillus faecipullorum]|nr:hypothetical protein [Candidatus Negativibacillus faecipullorum]